MRCQRERLERITRVMDHLEFIRFLRKDHPAELAGLMMGELDWLEELYGLLHDGDNE